MFVSISFSTDLFPTKLSDKNQPKNECKQNGHYILTVTVGLSCCITKHTVDSKQCKATQPVTDCSKSG